MADVGWPDPAWVVQRMESILSWVASWRSFSWSKGISSLLYHGLGFPGLSKMGLIILHQTPGGSLVETGRCRLEARAGFSNRYTSSESLANWLCRAGYNSLYTL